MPLEIGNTIESLDPSWPLGGDPTNKGDDHLRLIKNVLQLQFPGVAGDGFNTAIIATEEEINYLTGLSSNAQSQFNAITSRIDVLESTLSAPTGTALTFYNTNPPLGWTKQTSKNNFMLRVVSDTTGGTSGNNTGDSPILNNKIPTHNHTASSVNKSTAHTHTYSGTTAGNNVGHTHTGTTTTNGNHNHTRVGYNNYTGGSAYPGFDGSGDAHNSIASSTNGNHNHSFTTSGQSANHTHTYSGTTSAVSANSTHNHTITVNNNSGSTWNPKYVNMIIATKDA